MAGLGDNIIQLCNKDMSDYDIIIILYIILIQLIIAHAGND